MKIAAARREDDFEINVISLIDVLLTLLMFFVMTTTFVQHSSMKVTLPEASATEDGSEREALSPMTAFERKVVHDEVLAAGLVSESEGAEPRRFVVVLPA